MRLTGWLASALALSPNEIVLHQVQTPSYNSVSYLQQQASSLILSAEPSKDDVLLLRQTFSEFYGVERNLDTSIDLLNKVVERWQSQPPDEQAGLYRVRADCHMLRGEAVEAFRDYDTALKLLDGPGKEKADPSELPLALLGRARSIQSQTTNDQTMLQVAAKDYERAIKLSSREEWDTDQELLEDGATRNPYATWEWGATLRKTNDWKKASYAHALASTAFEEIGDKARSIISLLDSGIDLAAAGEVTEAKALLSKAVPKTKGVEARDVALLQRVVAKEGEGRMALAALLWDTGEKPEAEKVLGDACIRLDQLQDDAMQRNAKKKASNLPMDPPPPLLKYSIDDTISVYDMTCSRFRNENFLQSLGWPQDLQKKVIRLEKLI